MHESPEGPINETEILANPSDLFELYRLADMASMPEQDLANIKDLSIQMTEKIETTGVSLSSGLLDKLVAIQNDETDEAQAGVDMNEIAETLQKRDGFEESEFHAVYGKS